MLRIIRQNASVRAQLIFYSRVLTRMDGVSGIQSGSMLSTREASNNTSERIPFERCMRGGACIYAVNATKLKNTLRVVFVIL